MKRLSIFVILLSLTVSVFSDNLEVNSEKSDANIIGHVIEKNTGEHLPFVNIRLEGTTIGVVSDATGHYMLTNLPVGEHVLVFSMVGFETQTFNINLEKGKTLEINAELEESSSLIDQVVVTSNKYETKKREAVSIVNVISPLLIESTASNSMSDVLDYQSGLRVEMSCQNCGAPQLRINGLDGQYTQILMDNRPIFSSLASVYGLEQIPTGMVDRVEVVRGGGSALYGANAIGGVVNIITKEPSGNSFNISNNTQLIGGKSWDINTNLNGSFVTSDSKIGAHLFGVIRSRNPYDNDNDGFSELPGLKSVTAGFRSYFKTSTLSKLTLEYHHVTEKRRGGNNFDLPEHEADIAESTNYNIDAGGLRWDYFSDNERHFVTTYLSAQYINRSSYYGVEKNPNAYGKSNDITTVVGGQYRFHMYNCLFMPADLSAGIEYSYNGLKDQILDYGRDMTQLIHVVGGYVQNEWKNNFISFLIGLRLEKHNLLKNPIPSPRVNIRYTPIDQIVIRASYASGYRAPQAYEEDLHVGAVGGDVYLISLADDLKPEMSHSTSLSVDWAKKFGKTELNITAEGFFTQLNNVFTLTENGRDESGNLLLQRVNSKGARVAGLNFEAKVAYKSLFMFQLGYTYQISRYIEPFKWSEDLEAQNRMFRSPDHYGYFLSTINPFKRFSINLNGKLSGPMLVQHYAGVIPTDAEVVTPTFFDMGIKISYDIPIYRLYSLQINVGVKNIFNAYQKDIDKGVYRDAAYIYGPSLPRTYIFGLAINI